jgi:hypothetical protein
MGIGEMPSSYSKAANSSVDAAPQTANANVGLLSLSGCPAKIIAVSTQTFSNTSVPAYAPALFLVVIRFGALAR